MSKQHTMGQKYLRIKASLWYKNPMHLVMSTEALLKIRY